MEVLGMFIWIFLLVGLGALGLIPVAVAQVLHNSVRPPLGGWFVRAGGSVTIRHSYVDPANVRARLRRGALIIAAPGLLGSPALGVLASFAFADPGASVTWQLGTLLALGVIGAPSALALAVVGWRVGGRRDPGATLATLNLVGCVASAPPAIAAALAVGPGNWLSITLASLTAVWMLGAVGLANDLRIVATWDRLCTHYHPERREAGYVGR